MPADSQSRLEPKFETANMITPHSPNVMTCLRHRISHAMAVGIHSKIATIQKFACGDRNSDNFKVAAYFHCGGLHLGPPR